MLKAVSGLAVVMFGVAVGQASSAFEVASIKPNKTTGGRPSIEFSPGGERFTAVNTSLGQLIILAYGVSPLQLSPLEPVVYEKYDVQAKADRAVTRAEMLRMLQALLADRFKLSIRKEMREAPAYALVLAKGGSKLRLSEIELPWSFSRARGNELKGGRMIFENESMPDFASVLTTLVVIGRVVVDETGLKGNYDFALSFAPPGAASDPASTDPSIFTAVQEQLGLKLEPRKAPVEFFVIEHVERPSGN